jgi:predicted porin
MKNESETGTSFSTLEIVAMKKSLLALAVLGAFAGTASAQSFVTISGKLDQGVGKFIGSAEKVVLDGASGAANQQWIPANVATLPSGGSRIGFFGREDLGSGLGAVFGFESRFSPDTGVQGDAAKFWNGFSYVGLSSAQAGRLTIGRHYNANFLNIQNQVDPFDGETTGALRGIGMLLGVFQRQNANGTFTNTGAIGRVRVDNSLKYDISAAGVSFGATVAESNPAGGETKRPYSAALSYAGGPIWVGVGYENPGNVNDKLINAGVKYTIGPVTLRGAYSKGTTSGNVDAVGYLVGANIVVGSGNIKVGYASAKLENPDVTVSKKAAVGYHYSLSKRTKLYADLTRDSQSITEKNGYDLGIQHSF